MSLAEWAGTLAGFAAFGATIIAATSWVLKSYLKNFVHELKPNGGSSMKDTVNKIHTEMIDLRISVARLEGRFTQHLDEIEKQEYSFTIPTHIGIKGET